jgi:tetratricopeptide (TPR) repeat protein
MLPDVDKALLFDTILGVCIAAQTGQEAAKWVDRLAAIEQRRAHEEPPRTTPPALEVLATVATKGTMKDEKVAEFTGDDLVGFAIMQELLASAKANPGIRAEAARLLKATAARDLRLTDVSRAWAMDVLKARPTSQWAAALAASGLTDPAALREILEIVKPDDCILARTLRASALEYEKQYAKAAEIYRLAAEAEKGNPRLIMHQAVATERAGRLQEAIPLYQQVWERTKNPTAANNAAYLVSELYPKDPTRLADAAKWADAALQAVPQSAAYRDTKGWIAYLQGRNDDALIELRRAVKGLPNSPEVHYHLGTAEAKAGNRMLARQHLEAAVSLGEHMASQEQEISAAVHKAIRLAKEALAKLGEAQK